MGQERQRDRGTDQQPGRPPDGLAVLEQGGDGEQQVGRGQQLRPDEDRVVRHEGRHDDEEERRQSPPAREAELHHQHRDGGHRQALQRHGRQLVRDLRVPSGGRAQRLEREDERGLHRRAIGEGPPRSEGPQVLVVLDAQHPVLRDEVVARRERASRGDLGGDRQAPVDVEDRAGGDARGHADTEDACDHHDAAQLGPGETRGHADRDEVHRAVDEIAEYRVGDREPQAGPRDGTRTRHHGQRGRRRGRCPTRVGRA